MKLIFSEVINRLKKELMIQMKSEKWMEDQDLAKIFGMTPASFSERRTRESLPYEKIITICRERGISSDHVFSGHAKEFNAKIIFDGDRSGIDDEKMMVVPYFENIASIHNDPSKSVSYIVLPKNDYPELMRENRQLHAVTITDDSMEGTILNGALLLFDINDKIMESGKVYIIRVGDENMVKRLFNDPTSPDTVLLKSDSIYYPKFDIPRNNLEVIGHVIVIYNRGKLI